MQELLDEFKRVSRVLEGLRVVGEEDAEEIEGDAAETTGVMGTERGKGGEAEEDAGTETAAVVDAVDGEKLP